MHEKLPGRTSKPECGGPTGRAFRGRHSVTCVDRGQDVVVVIGRRGHERRRRRDDSRRKEAFKNIFSGIYDTLYTYPNYTSNLITKQFQ